jgi:hypothetical protein
MRRLGYDKDNADHNSADKFGDYLRQAQKSLIDDTRKDVEDNLKNAQLNKQEVYMGLYKNSGSGITNIHTKECD